MSPAVSGIVFDIKEFTLHDGPGLRTTVFLKGCPLDCSWCHNPEGKSAKPQVMQSPAGERVAGQIYTAADLAGKLNRHAHILRLNQGGVTFSGGEPLLQAAFLAEVIDQLDEVHVLLDTSGYGNEQDFRLLVERSDLVYFDLKLVDEAPHRQFTGLDNRPILHNLQVLSQLGTSFVLRVPLIPGVTDTAENLEATARLAASLPDPPPVELLSYNPLAGAKYASAGIEYRPVFDPRRPVEPRLEIFARWGLQVKFHKRSGDAIEAG